MDPEPGSDCHPYLSTDLTSGSLWPNHILFNITQNFIWHPLWEDGVYVSPFEIAITPPASMCNKFYIPYPGTFALDENGMLIYTTPNSCTPLPLDCPQFCAPIPPVTLVTNVVASNATTYSDVWDYPTADYANGSTTWPGTRNDFELGKRGKWRPSSHFAYMTPLNPGTKNYDQGMYDMALFNYSDPALNDNTPWIRTDLVTRYSPEGHILEELDALGKPSAAKFGYDKMLPTLVAQNSVNSLVLFESFEKKYPTVPQHTLEDGVTFSPIWPLSGWITTKHHSGKYSYQSGAAAGILFQSPTMAVPDIANTPLFQNRTMLVKCWINARNASGATEATDLQCAMVEPGSSNAINVAMERVARTGDWVQYSATVPVWSNAADIKFEITCTNPSGTTTAIDDVRIQPVDAQMMTYVYDAKNLRLVTSFDDQHFGQYYQYNGEGKLIRKQIETERGFKTIQENQQNTPLQ